MKLVTLRLRSLFRRPLRLPLALAALAIACGGLSPNQKGDLSAERTGSMTLSLAPRLAPDADLLSSCGDGAPTAEGKTALRRAPFLQQVTTDSAYVVFRVSSPAPVTVDVTTVRGRKVSSPTSLADPSVSDGTQQLVRLTGLEPAKTYCYELRGLTGRAGFRTAPAPTMDV